MKTKVTTKPQSAKSVKIVPAKSAKSAKPTKQAEAAKPKTLYFFDMVPGGNMLRAYFIALICAQTGKLTAGSVFKLWPHANIRGHLLSGKIERKEGAYTMTSAGVNYFSDEKQKPQADLYEGFLKAVTSGEKPKFYNYAMSELK